MTVTSLSRNTFEAIRRLTNKYSFTILAWISITDLLESKCGQSLSLSSFLSYGSYLDQSNVTIIDQDNHMAKLFLHQRQHVRNMALHWIANILQQNQVAVPSSSTTSEECPANWSAQLSTALARTSYHKERILLFEEANGQDSSSNGYRKHHHWPLMKGSEDWYVPVSLRHIAVHSSHGTAIKYVLYFTIILTFT